ncbi:MAG: response regulator [Planctomycetota bacterium]|nr:response regulator [Planctomycetota bacterium]
MPDGGSLVIETDEVELDEEYCSKKHGVKPGQYIMLAVTDSGVGMNREQQERLFEPFYTTKGEGKGTGLGLATSFGIVKQHGGAIWVYSELGKGTTIKVYLPVSAEQKRDIKTSSAHKPLQKGTETVLVAEDNEMVRSFTKHVLEVHGYTVLAASCGTEAVQLSKEEGKETALLLTDVVMPEISGMELKNILKKDNPELKVLFMSGYTENVIAHSGVLYKDIEFIQKPFTVSGLLKKVREVLDKE